MQKKAWWKEGIVYQIYPRSFMDSNGDGIGDLNGITRRLDYLKNLGVTILWISPFYKSPNVDNGYDISDYQAIQKEFGTMEDFDRLLTEAHLRGLKIMIDLVVNHTSTLHPWFLESKKNRTNRYRDFYIWKDPKDGHAPNNWGSCFAQSAWQFDEKNGQYYLHMFAPEQADLNWENEAVRTEIYKMMTWWCDKGIDGFRMDVISMISKQPGFPDGKKTDGMLYGDSAPYTQNGPHVHEYLKEMNTKVLSRYDLATVGETPGVTVEEAKKYAGFDSKELSMVFQFEASSCDSEDNGNKFTDKRFYLPDLKKIYAKWQTGLEGTAWNSLFLENHDQPRSIARYADAGKYRTESAKMLATSIHLQQGTPYIYEGEELGMTNCPFYSLDECRDIETFNVYKKMTEQGVSPDTMMRYINLKGRDTARTPMQWSKAAHAGFTTGTPWIKVNPNYQEINAEDEIQDPGSVYHYYKKLIRLRKENPVMVYGKFKLLLPDDEDIFAYTRTLEKTQLLVICSYTDKRVPFEIENKYRNASVFISNYNLSTAPVPGSYLLQPYEALVLKISQ
jgi:oligo-1,6-glucosidase